MGADGDTPNAMEGVSAVTDADAAGHCLGQAWATQR